MIRYSASGSTHRNGTLAMFWVMWLVTASSITEPIAESASQCSCVAASAVALPSFPRVCPGCRCPSWTAKPIAAHSTANAGEEERPAPAERLQVERRLEQQREAEQREQRGEIGKREQAIGHRALEAAPVPRLQQRRGGREQEVRQADGRARAAAGCARSAPRRPAASSRSRRGSAGRRATPRAARRAASPGGARPGASSSRRRRSRRAARSGRTPGRWSTPPPSRRTTAGSAWR